MLSSILIIAVSVILFAYWFRYSCILILRNAGEQVGSEAADSRFTVATVKAQLQNGDALDPLHAALNRDYQVLSYLLQHAAGLELASFEDRLLVVDYKVMRVYYSIMRLMFPQQARTALAEMASVLDVLVHRMNQQAGI